MSGSKPLMTSGVEIGRSIAPSCAPAAAGMPNDLDVGRTIARTAPAARTSRVSAAVSPSRVIGSSMRACGAGARRVIAVASFISAIGVMPAIASFENAPIEYDTAPISRPSM